MNCITNPIVKHPLSMANACLISLPSQFTPKSTSSYPYLSISIHSNPIKFQSSCCNYSSSIFDSKARFPAVVALVSSQEIQVDEDSAAEEEFSEDAKVFIGNLSFAVDSAALAELFEQAGTVEIAEVIYNRETEQSRGFGFVTMSSVEEAEKAVELLNGYEFNGRVLTVNKAAPKGSRPERAPRSFETGNRIYVGNLPWDVDDSSLQQIFSEFGDVVNARVVCDRDTGRSRGFGFVTMSNESELNDAISNLDGKNVGGRAIRVNVAETRDRRSSF